MGRPPKPTALKLLHGDDKKNPQRINRSEPQPGRGSGEPPSWLPAEACEVWAELAPRLLATGLLTSVDGEAFASFCEAVVRRRDAVKKLGAEGAVVPSDIIQGGIVVGVRMVKSPWTLVLKEADAQMAHWGSRFGMTPADRAKISVGGADRGEATDDLFAGGA